MTRYGPSDVAVRAVGMIPALSLSAVGETTYCEPMVLASDGTGAFDTRQDPGYSRLVKQFWNSGTAVAALEQDGKAKGTGNRKTIAVDWPERSAKQWLLDKEVEVKLPRYKSNFQFQRFVNQDKYPMVRLNGPFKLNPFQGGSKAVLTVLGICDRKFEDDNSFAPGPQNWDLFPVREKLPEVDQALAQSWTSAKIAKQQTQSDPESTPIADVDLDAREEVGSTDESTAIAVVSQ